MLPPLRRPSLGQKPSTMRRYSMNGQIPQHQLAPRGHKATNAAPRMQAETHESPGRRQQLVISCGPRIDGARATAAPGADVVVVATNDDAAGASFCRSDRPGATVVAWARESVAQVLEHHRPAAAAELRAKPPGPLVVCLAWGGALIL